MDRVVGLTVGGISVDVAGGTQEGADSGLFSLKARQAAARGF